MFSFNGIKYKIINRRKRAVGTGDYSSIEPNAVDDNTITELIIPEQVKNEKNVFFRVTEIGPHSFGECSRVTSVFVPSSVEIIHDFGFHRLVSCTSFVFGENSKLRRIGTKAIYDFYLLEKIIFTGNCLTTIGSQSIQYSKNLQSIMLPSSVRKIEGGAIGGTMSIKTIYYCGSTFQGDNILSGSPDVQTNPSVLIYTTSKYKESTFGGWKVTSHDADDVCIKKSDICREFFISCRSKHYSNSNFVFVLVSMLIK